MYVCVLTELISQVAFAKNFQTLNSFPTSSQSKIRENVNNICVCDLFNETFET